MSAEERSGGWMSLMHRPCLLNTLHGGWEGRDDHAAEAISFPGDEIISS